MKVLRQIFPKLKMVEVYRALETVEMCSGARLCSAEPVVEGLVMKAEDIFRQV